MTRIVVRFDTAASAQATAPTARMRRNSATSHEAEIAGEKPAAPENTTRPIASAPPQ